MNEKDAEMKEMEEMETMIISLEVFTPANDASWHFDNCRGQDGKIRFILHHS